MSGIWVEFYGFPPDEFFYIFLRKRWQLEVNNERTRAHGLLVDIMKRRQVWMAQSLINCISMTLLYLS